MDVQELLKPRYKAIASYPYCPYNVGDLVEFSDLGTSFHCTTTKEWNVFTEEFEDSVNYFSIDVLDMWKHLFKKLEWWEERSENDMPKYLKQDTHPNDFCLVLRHFTEEKDYCCTAISKLFGKNTTIHYKNYLPATQEEYETQNK